MTSRRPTLAPLRTSDPNQGGTTAALDTEAPDGVAVSPASEHRGRIADLARRFFSPLFDYLGDFLAPREACHGVQAALLRDGYVAAAGLLIAAVLVNHVRRILVPWLGQFLWWHPVEAMKMARGSPHYFLQEQLVGLDVATLGQWMCQVMCLTFAKRFLRRCIIIIVTTGQSRHGSANGFGNAPKRRRIMAAAVDVCSILYLAICLAEIEAAYAELCWAGAWVYATVYIWRRGSLAQLSFMRKLFSLGDQPTQSRAKAAAIAVVGLLLAHSGWRRVVRPFLRPGGGGGGLRVAVSALAVLWGLLGAGTVHVVRYSNRYFILLEMTDLLVTWLWMILAVVVVVVWRLRRDEEKRTKVA